jgi:hypothetical protein
MIEAVFFQSLPLQRTLGVNSRTRRRNTDEKQDATFGRGIAMEAVARVMWPGAEEG